MAGDEKKRGEWTATVSDNEYHRFGRAVHRLRPKPTAADPETRALKKRLREAMQTIERLNAERESGADMRAALAPLGVKTFAQILADQIGSNRRPCRTVSDKDLERLDEVVGWLEAIEPTDRLLVLEWARGTPWLQISTELGVSRWTAQRYFRRALAEILLSLRAKEFFSSCTKSKNLA